MTKKELEIGRAKARVLLKQLLGWKAGMVSDDTIDHVIQGVVEAIDDYRKAKKD